AAPARQVQEETTTASGAIEIDQLTIHEEQLHHTELNLSGKNSARGQTPSPPSTTTPPVPTSPAAHSDEESSSSRKRALQSDFRILEEMLSIL
ncbi:unnamed protein product, partial [Amoebophrya sp. A120]